MNIPSRLAMSLLGLVVAGRASAQDTSPPKADQVIALNPFEVKADSDQSYGALNSNSITRFNTEMDKLPVSADIFTETFMNDVAATTVEDMITTYAAGAGYTSAVDSSTSAASNQPGDRNGNAYIQLRGLSTPAMERDGFMPVGSFGNPGSTGVSVTSNFDLERVEVINGPQALLYGGGGAGGVINVVSKQARFGQTSQGSALFRIDQYGAKEGQFDYNAGNGVVAVRVAVIDQTVGGRRIDIGGGLQGQYFQAAVKLFGNTTIRAETEQTTFHRMLAVSPSLTAPTTDPRNGLKLHYLLATGQTGAVNPATGAAYPSGAIDHGLVNWGNVDSFAGWQYEEPVVNEYSSIQADTQWNHWLSTQVAAGYDAYRDDRINPGFTFYAPGGSGNNLSGWSAGLTPSLSWQPARTKAVRFSALATNEFFGGKVKSQTILGWDFVRTDMAQIGYSFAATNPDGSLVLPTTGTFALSTIPKQIWSIDNGPVQYPGFYPDAKAATVNGTTYIRTLTNPVNASLISPANPLGTVLTSGNYILTKIFNKGIYGINYSQWDDGKLDTLAGFRASQSDEDRMQQAGGRVRWLETSKTLSFDAGADYAVQPWLHPYVTVSNSFSPPFLANASDPYNNPPTTSHSLGEEAGLKLSSEGGAISGSLAAYHVESKNDLYQTTSSITTEIDPAGLNGGGGGAYVSVARDSRGVELKLTAAPSPNLRLRVGASWIDGSIGTTNRYAQVYNDQFYANAQGQVTFADGALVYVSPTFNSKTPAYNASNAPAGSIPLTITAMSTPSNAYYANPNPVSGAINTGSNAASVLKFVDSSHGAILTGATFLPISALQLNQSLAGINPPGIITATQAGDSTVGYPEYSMNATGIYTFTRPWLKGLSLGGTVLLGWKERDYYYYPTGVSGTNTTRTLYYLPNQTQFNLIAGYTRKLGRITWKSQLNVNNLLNHYHVIILPNATTGYTVPSAIDATFASQPRDFVWSNTISF